MAHYRNGACRSYDVSIARLYITSFVFWVYIRVVVFTKCFLYESIDCFTFHIFLWFNVESVGYILQNNINYPYLLYQNIQS